MNVSPAQNAPFSKQQLKNDAKNIAMCTATGGAAMGVLGIIAQKDEFKAAGKAVKEAKNTLKKANGDAAVKIAQDALKKAKGTLGNLGKDVLKQSSKMALFAAGIMTAAIAAHKLTDVLTQPISQKEK